MASRMFTIALIYFLRLPPAFEDKNVGINVFKANPTRERQSGIGPNPVHHRPQLCQEGHQTKPSRGDKTKKIKTFFANHLCKLSSLKVQV